MYCLNERSYLGVFFSDGKNLQLENNFRKKILNIESILKMWRQRNLTPEVKIIIFKTLALSKITFLAQVLVIPNHIIDGLQRIQKYFLWNSSSPKVKHETICKDFHGGLKNIDIKSKIISLQCFWIKKLYDERFHEWKIIPLTLIKNTFGECFIFHPNLNFNVSLNWFPEFYINILYAWKNTFALLSLTPSCLRSQFLWFNKDIKINNKPLHFQDFLKKNINFVEHLCKPSGVFQSWSEIKSEYNLEGKMFYNWCQLSLAIPNQWKRIIKTTNDSCFNIVYLSHHLVKNNRIVALEKLHSKEIYSLIISQNMSTPTSQHYFKTLFPHLNLDWKLVYLLPRILTKNTSLRAFQYKVLNIVLYLYLIFFQFKVSTTSLCSHCNQHDETVQHLSSKCNKVISLWAEIKLYFANNIKLIALCPQIVILGYTNTDDGSFITQNLILLIFKF